MSRASYVPGFAIGGLAVAVGGPVLIAGILVAVVWIALVVVVMTALNAIFQTALYRYAAGVDSHGAFAGHDFSAAFAPKPGGRSGGFGGGIVGR